MSVCIHDTAGCPTGCPTDCQTGDDLTGDVLTMEGRFDWERYAFGTFRRRDVLTMGGFDCKARQQREPEQARPVYSHVKVLHCETFAARRQSTPRRRTTFFR